MTRADWMAAERAFDRREELPKEYEMGQGRWSKWSVGGEEWHTLEFGFAYRFDVRAGPRSSGLHPDFWYASARAGSLGEFPTFGAAAQACEDEARRLIEEALQRGDREIDVVHEDALGDLDGKIAVAQHAAAMGPALILAGLRFLICLRRSRAA